MADLKQIADRMGYETLSQPDVALRYGVEKLIAENEQVFLKDLIAKQSTGSRFVVGNSTYRRSSEQHTKTVRQSFVYFHHRDLYLPAITIKPASFKTSVLSSMLSFMGVQTVSFGQPAGFDDTFVVQTFQPETTRAVLNDEIRQLLMERPNLSVRTSESRILFSKEQAIVPFEEWESWVESILPVVAAISRRALKVPGIEDQAREEALKTYSGMGLLGSALMGTCIPRQDVESFVDQAPPRQIPRAVRNDQFGSNAMAMYLSCLVAMAVGTLFVVLPFYTNDLPKWVSLLGAPFAMGGLVAFVLVNAYLRRKKRLLRLGEVREAKIKKVERTNTLVNNRRRYRVYFDCDGNEVRINCYDPAVGKALRTLEADQPTRLLVDPIRPERVFWIEMLTSL